MSTKSFIHKPAWVCTFRYAFFLIHMHISTYFLCKWHKSIQICMDKQPFFVRERLSLRPWNHLDHLQYITNNRLKKCYWMSKFYLQNKIAHTPREVGWVMTYAKLRSWVGLGLGEQVSRKNQWNLAFQISR